MDLKELNNDLEARVAALESQMVTDFLFHLTTLQVAIQSMMTAQQSEVTAVQKEVATVESHVVQVGRWRWR
jgi:hypothetical protein